MFPPGGYVIDGAKWRYESESAMADVIRERRDDWLTQRIQRPAASQPVVDFATSTTLVRLKRPGFVRPARTHISP
jgi:hypothetical protein